MPDAPQPMQQQYDDDACDDGAVDVRITYCYPFGMQPGAFANHDLQAEQPVASMLRPRVFTSDAACVTYLDQHSLPLCPTLHGGQRVIDASMSIRLWSTTPRRASRAGAQSAWPFRPKYRTYGGLLSVNACRFLRPATSRRASSS